MTKPKNDAQTLNLRIEELTEALGKIESAVLMIQESTKALNQEINSFKVLMENTETHLHTAITSASQNMVTHLVKDLSSKAESKISDVIEPLDHSVQYALRALHETKRRKRLRLVGFILLSCLLSTLIGFIVGYSQGL